MGIVDTPDRSQVYQLNIKMAFSDLYFFFLEFSICAFGGDVLPVEDQISHSSDVIPSDIEFDIFSIDFDFFISDIFPIQFGWVF